MNSDQFFCKKAQPQGSHPGSKKYKFLLLVKKTQRMIKSPCHRQTCNVKSPSYARPPPLPPPPQRLNIDRCISSICLHILLAAMLEDYRGPPAWQLHTCTRLCNFVRNISTNISTLGQRTHLKRGELSSSFTVYNIIIFFYFIRCMVFLFYFLLRDNAHTILKYLLFWLGHPLFFLCLASSDRPRFSAFSKKKKITQRAMKAMTRRFKQFLL